MEVKKYQLSHMTDNFNNDLKDDSVNFVSICDQKQYFYSPTTYFLQ